MTTRAIRWEDVPTLNNALQRAHTALDEATMLTRDEDLVAELTAMMRRLRIIMRTK